MFKIHPEQMAACSEVSEKSFAEKITAHLVDSLPAPSAALGAPALQGMIERGIARAATHGITGRSDVCLFLAAGAVLGEGFDTDAALPWVAGVLGPDNPLDAASKVRQLWSVVESDVLPVAASQGGAGADAEASVAVAVGLAEAAKGALAGPLPVSRPVVPCPLRPRTYPFSL